ncbi:putative oxoglutarate dehydrogenase (succinyl-transferring) [Dioscorea sansibarensis]
MIETGEGINWPLGEALAFATLLVEGNHVRLSGQEVERVTFSYQHSVIHVQETGEKYSPLYQVAINQKSSCLLSAMVATPYEISEMDPSLRKQIQECNLQVVNVTAPANYFHVLRHQILRKFCKPLTILTPKNLLRHKDCKSRLSKFDDVLDDPEFGKQGTCFKRLIEDQNGHRGYQMPYSVLGTGQDFSFLVPFCVITGRSIMNSMKNRRR